MPNRYDPDVIDEPVSNPVTVEEVKLHSKISGSAEDSLLEIYISAAREYLESRTGRTFFQKTLKWSLDYWPGLGVIPQGGLQVPTIPNQFGGSLLPRYIELPQATPLVEIVSVKYTDSDGNITTWDPGEYIADTISRPGRLVLGFNKAWPTFTPLPAGAIQITYTAGTYYLNVLPKEGVTKLACLLMVGGMYENRESEIIPDRAVLSAVSMRYGVETYINSLRVPSQWVEM